MDDIQRLSRLIRAGARIAFFGGAGVSCESGIPDFRSDTGLYRRKYAYPPEEMLSHSFFIAHTQAFYDFYRADMLYPAARPNKAHYALARLEAQGKLTHVITQNIDGLHQAAGSKNVLELHGSVHRNFCMACGRGYALSYILQSAGVPRCACGGVIKPDVVLYEEPLDDQVVEAAVAAIRACDLLIIGGTSLTVYPAAGLVRYCKGTVAVINRSVTDMDARASVCVRAPIGETLDRCLREGEAE